MGDTAMTDFIIVGAGCAGATAARALAEAGRAVRVVEKRPHIAGNAYDEHDPHGVLIYRYEALIHAHYRCCCHFQSQTTFAEMFAGSEKSVPKS
jgi:UDP-galactopyranose mutase